MGTGSCCGRKNASRAYSPDKILPSKPHERIPRESSAQLRFTNIDVATEDPLQRIKGYEKEPVVSLETALEPFQGKIEHLSHFIQVAKQKCHHPSKHELTIDESAAIYIYTMKWSKKCLYDHLKEAWKSNGSSKLKPWFKYFKLLKTGLDKLPDAKGEIWQVTPYNEKQKEILSSDLLYISMGSCAQSVKDLIGHLGEDSGGRKIFVSYAFANGKVVTEYTANQWNEVFVFPGAKLGKAEFKESGDGMLYVHFTRKYKQYTESKLPKISSTKKHFVCQCTGCGNYCPGDHDPDHCHTFAITTHTCQHHCGCGPPCFQCKKCRKFFPTVCKCYKCGSSYCEKCCYK